MPTVGFVVAAVSAAPVGLTATRATFAVIGTTWVVFALSAASPVRGWRARRSSVRLGAYIALSALVGGLRSALAGLFATIDFALAFLAAGPRSSAPGSCSHFDGWRPSSRARASAAERGDRRSGVTRRGRESRS